MRWRTVFVIAGVTSTSAVLVYRRNWLPAPVEPDRIAVFRRILTVTNLMCLAGNRPDIESNQRKSNGARGQARGRRPSARVQDQERR